MPGEGQHPEMMRDQAEDALARSARGDPVAFEEIVRQHQAMVFSIAYHFLGDAPDAEEVAQDVFLKLHRNLPAIKSAAHLTAWLRKVTTHRSIDQARRRGPSPPLSLDDVPELADTIRIDTLARRGDQQASPMPPFGDSSGTTFPDH